MADDLVDVGVPRPPAQRLEQPRIGRDEFGRITGAVVVTFAP